MDSVETKAKKIVMRMKRIGQYEQFYREIIGVRFEKPAIRSESTLGGKKRLLPLIYYGHGLDPSQKKKYF